MALNVNDTEELEMDAPRPVDADSVANGSFETLHGDQGAKSVSRGRHSANAAGRDGGEGTQPLNKRTLAVIGVAAIVAISVIVVLFVRMLSASPSTVDNSEPEQIAVSADEQVSNHGSSYELVQNSEGTYQLVEAVGAGGGTNVVLGDIPGTPANLVLYDGAILIPENLEDGTWDVLAYTIGSGWTQIMDQEGRIISASGTIEDARLEGTTIVLTVDGQRYEVPLVW